MTIRLHRGDLPDLAHYKVGVVAIDTETMGLDLRRDRLCVVQLSPGDGSADVVQVVPGASGAAKHQGAAGRSRHHQVVPFRPLRHRHAVSSLRRDVAAGLLHQDRVAAGAHLHRQAWPQGPRARAPGRRPVEAAAIVRLGGRRAHRRPGRLCRLRRAAICMRSRTSSTPCWPGKGGAAWPRPVSGSCRIGCGSIWPAGAPKTFFPIVNGGAGAAAGPHLCATVRENTLK